MVKKYTVRWCLGIALALSLCTTLLAAGNFLSCVVNLHLRERGRTILHTCFNPKPRLKQKSEWVGITSISSCQHPLRFPPVSLGSGFCMQVIFGLYITQHFVIIQAEDKDAEVKPFLNMLTALFIYHYYNDQISARNHVLPYSHSLSGLSHT